MTKAIGQKLYISPYTVSRHLRNICQKFHARNSIHLISILSNIGQIPKTHSLLSERENQIMNLIMEGFNSRDISKKLGITLATSRKHRENILRKLKAGSIRQALTFFMSNYLSQ